MLPVVGRVEGATPSELVVKATVGGREIEERVALRERRVTDEGDLRLRWAGERLRQLLLSGGQREEIADLGVRYGLITPYTSFYVPSAAELASLGPAARELYRDVHELRALRRERVSVPALAPSFATLALPGCRGSDAEPASAPGERSRTSGFHAHSARGERGPSLVEEVSTRPKPIPPPRVSSSGAHERPVSQPPISRPPVAKPVSQPPATKPVSQPPATRPVSQPSATRPVSQPPAAGRVSSPPVSREPTAAAAEPDLAEDRRKKIDDLYVVVDLLDHYQVLGIERSADRANVKSAYFDLSKQFHPDTVFRKSVGPYRQKMEVIFKRLTEAYDVLSKKKPREEYDAYLARTEKSQEYEQTLSGQHDLAKAIAALEPEEAQKKAAAAERERERAFEQQRQVERTREAEREREAERTREAERKQEEERHGRGESADGAVAHGVFAPRSLRPSQQGIPAVRPASPPASRCSTSSSAPPG